MEKIIKIADKEVRLNNNVAWTMEYRDQFNKDILPAIMPLVASFLETSAAVFEGKKGEITFAEIIQAFEGRTLDILLPMFQAEFVELVVDVTWAMAKAADDTIDPPKKWVRQFESFPVDVIIPVVGELAVKGFISSKNLKRLKKITESVKTLQPSHLTTSSLQDSSEA